MPTSDAFKFLFTIALVLDPMVALAQSAYDPPTTATFSQATAAMSPINGYYFGTNSGNNITNLTQLSAAFNPYGTTAGTNVINTEWERYQPFNYTNFVFTPSWLNLTATIPSGGGLYPGGIDSAQIWSKQSYQPGSTGQTVYAMSIRMKFPTGQGMWPAIWLTPIPGGDASEVDIVEFEIMQWQNQTDWTGFDHGPGVGSAIYSLLTNPWVWQPGLDFSAAFHNYQVIWTPDATYKYFDDQLVYAQFFQWTARSPAQLGVNLAVGSNVSSLPGLMPTSLSEFPSAVQLQSINVLGGATANPSAPAPPPPSNPGTSSAASFEGLDTATEGAWASKYGQNGDFIASYAANSPAYASVSLSGDSLWTWANPTSDPRALKTATGAIASAYYGSTFNINVNLTDGNAHLISLYLLDWDTTTRTQTISILDASTLAVLDTEAFSNFHNGEYASWSVKGNVIIQVKSTGGINALVSGIFFSAAPSSSVTATAAYNGLDTTTQGTWTNNYGSDGYLIANDATNAPAYASVSQTGELGWTWVDPTYDVRALQLASGSSARIASTYYSTGNSFSININLTDGNTHRIALYLLDWDYGSRNETISILDAASQTVLSSQTFANFQSGAYASWNVKGNVIVQVTKNTGINAAVAGIFFR